MRSHEKNRMPYAVYKVYFDSTPHNHVALYVETRGHGRGGFLYHVRGAIEVHGMYFAITPCNTPSQFPSFLRQELVGLVKEDMLALLEEVCESVPPPERQYNENGPIQPKRPRRRCSDWFDELLTQLINEGIVEEY